MIKEMFVYENEINKDDYIICTYRINEDNLSAPWNIAIGQSIGNPNVRNHWETDLLIKNHACKIIIPTYKYETSAFSTLSAYDRFVSLHYQPDIKIAFPLSNIDLYTDGVSQLLCHIMGGLVDIDEIKYCRLIDIEISEKNVRKYFKGPRFGLSGMKEITRTPEDRPLLGTIIKPKTGLSPNQLLDMVKFMVDGGTNFIKEDEILSNPTICPLDKRLETIGRYLINHPEIVYCVCINSDSIHLEKRTRMVKDSGVNGIHVNIWSGLGTYKSLRELDLDLFIHFQRSGDATFTHPDNKFSISWDVICKLAGWSGVDSIHAGMWGGYKNESEKNIKHTMKILTDLNVVPSLSCGLHPGMIRQMVELFGSEWMATSGGSIHGHPEGTLAGTLAFRQAIDQSYGHEYATALNKWGVLI